MNLSFHEGSRPRPPRFPLTAAILVLRKNKFGYAVGFVSGAFWLDSAAFRTTFVRNGFERLLRGDVPFAAALVIVPRSSSPSSAPLILVVSFPTS